MKKTFVSFLLIMFTASAAYCQRIQPLNNTGSTEITLDVKVDDIGPRGSSSYSFPSNDKVDSILLAGYPKLKNLPDSLTELKVYTLIRDQMQFYYQNYRNGIYTKQYFLDRFKNNKFLNQDTLKLTNQTMKCYFSYAVGYDSKGNPKYVIDENGNHDFADDQLRTLTKKTLSLNSDLRTLNSIQIAIEYYDGKNICIEKIPCILNLSGFQNSTDKKIFTKIIENYHKICIIIFTISYFDVNHTKKNIF